MILGEEFEVKGTKYKAIRVNFQFKCQDCDGLDDCRDLPHCDTIANNGKNLIFKKVYGKRNNKNSRG